MKDYVLREGPRLRRRLLVALVFLVPVLVLPFFHNPFTVPKMGAIALVVGVVAGIRGAELLYGADVRGLKRLVVPALMFCVPLAVAWAFSPYKAWALAGHYPRFTGLVPYVIAVIAGMLIADAFAGRGAQLAWAMLAAGALVGAYGISQFFGFDPVDWEYPEGLDRYPASTLGNTNFAGGMLAFTLPLALGLWLTFPGRRPWITGAVALIVGGWAVSVSEGGWAAGVAALAVTGGCVAVVRWRRAPLAGALAAGAIALSMVVIVIAAVNMPGRLPVPRTAEERGEWWIAAVRMAGESPIVGRGPGTFTIDWTQFRTERDGAEAGSASTDDPHSVPLLILTSGGALALAGFVGVAVWIARTGPSLAIGQPLPAAFLGGATAYLVQSLITVDVIPLRFAFWLCLGGLVSAALPVDEPLKKQRKKKRAAHTETPVAPHVRWVIAGALGVTAMGASLWGARVLLADARVEDAGSLFREGHGEPAFESFEAAISLRDEVVYRRLYADHLKRAAIALAEGDRMDFARSLFERARAQLSYVEEVPHANSTVDLARLLVAWGRFDDAVEEEALETYETALRLDPENVELRAEVEEARAELAVSSESVSDTGP